MRCIGRSFASIYLSVAALCATAQVFTPVSGWPGADGVVYALALDEANGILYLGGDFTAFGGMTRNRLAAVDVNTGSMTSWAPSVNGSVRSILVHDNTVYVGGDFTEVDGDVRTRLAAIDATSGVLGSWAPSASGTVRSMIAGPSTIYIAGAFVTVNGTTRNNLAAVDATSGLLATWNPNANSNVNDMAWKGGNIAAVGVFTNVGGLARDRIVELDTVTGTPTAWAPAANAVVNSLVIGDGSVYLGGQFTALNGSSRTGLGAVDPVTGANMLWAPTHNGSVQRLTMRNGVVYLGGFFPLVNSVSHPNFAGVDGSTGNLLVGSPTSSSTVYGIIATDQRLYVAGVFTSMNGTLLRDRFAVFDVCTPVNWYADTDEDGFGDPLAVVNACSAPEGYVADSTDCDDNDMDMGAPTLWYFDGDEDEFGDPFNFLLACSQPEGYVEEGIDCDDNDPDIVLGGPCDDGDPYTVNDVQRGYPDCDCVGQTVVVSAKVLLQGPYVPVTGLMKDDLREAGLIPAEEPYTDLLYELAPGSLAGGDAVDPSVLTVTGPDAIVDWVILELRAGNDGTEPISTRYVLVQRDGDVVETDGVSPVRFAVPYGYYRLAVVHRNHMGVVEGGGQFSNGNYFEVASVDFTDPGLAVHGDPGARSMDNGTMLLRNGDTSFNDDLRYVGANNDRDPILQMVGGSVPTNIITGYHIQDVNMDGVVRYSGANNDRDPILSGIGGSAPTNVLLNTYLRPTF